MAKVNYVKSARKDYPEHGIKAGEPYYWWQFNFDKYKHYSKTPPKRSQLTKSYYLAQIYDLEDRISEAKATDFSDLESLRDEFVSDIQSLLDETQERLDNMPEHLRESSSSGETLQERIDTLEGAISELENIEIEEPDESSEREEDMTDEDWENYIQEKLDGILEEIQNISLG